MEEFSKNCRFILTCNFKNKIIEPLHSRCGVIEFNTNKSDLARLCQLFMNRALNILSAEGVEVTNHEVLAELIMKHAPDWRRILNELQRHSRGGTLHLDVLSVSMSGNINDLFGHLKNKDFKTMRKWVAENMDSESATIMRALYDNMNDAVSPNSIPQLVLILADYQFKGSFAADKELNMVACLTEVMAQVEFV